MSDKHSKKEKNYPRDLSDEELEEEIGRLGKTEETNGVFGATRFTKASLGLAELGRRNSDRGARWSLAIGVLGLVIALISIWFAYISFKEAQSSFVVANTTFLASIKPDIDIQSSTIRVSLPATSTT